MSETVERAGHRLRDGEPLSDEARAELVALLDHIRSDGVRDSVETHTWDLVMRFAEAVEQPHIVHRKGVGKLPSGWSRGEPPRAL